MATAVIQFRVNGGAVQTGTAEVVAEDEIALQASSYAGWQAARWEIQTYPDGFPEPTGWSTDGSSGAYFYNASPVNGITPPTITMPDSAAIDAGQWGKWIFRVIVTTTSGTLTSDPRCGVHVVSPNLGLKGLAYTEEAEFGGAERSHIGDYQHDQELIDAAALVSGGYVSSIAATTPIAVSAATGPVTVSWNATANVAMGGWGFTGASSFVNAGGAVAVTAGAGNATLDASASVLIGGTSATLVALGRAGQTLRAVPLAGSGAGFVAVDNSGNLSWTASPSVAAPLTLTLDDATSNNASTILTLRHTYNGGFGANGIGSQIAFEAEDSAGNNEVAGYLTFYLSDATNGAETSSFSLFTRTGGAAPIANFNIDGDGRILTYRTTSDTNTTIPCLQLTRLTSGTAANNIGASVDFIVQDAGTNEITAARIGARFSDATDGAHDAVLDFYTSDNGGSATANATLDNVGVWTTVGAMKTDAGFDTSTATGLAIGASATSVTVGNNGAAANIDHRLATSGSQRLYINNLLQRTTAAASCTWGETITTPTIGIDARTTDAATTTLRLAGQAAWASATGTNRNSGDVSVILQTPAGAGAEGFFNIVSSGTVIARFGRPNGTFETEVRYFPGAVVHRSDNLAASTFEIRGAGVYVSANNWRLQDSSQNQRVTTAISTSITTTYVADITAISDVWTQDASAAGGDRTWGGQRGFTGFAGGSLIFNVGDGGTQGTNAPGNIDFGLGTAVSSVVGKVRFKNAGGDVLGDIGTIAGPYLRLENSATTSSGLALNAAAGVVALQTGGTTRVTVSADGTNTTFTGRVDTPRVVSTATTPTSAANALTLDLSLSANPHHTTTEDTTVTISNGRDGQHGVIVFTQGASGKTITMPTNGVGVEYDDAILALGLTAIIDTSVSTRTALAYIVLPNNKAYIYARSVNTIP